MRDSLPRGRLRFELGLILIVWLGWLFQAWVFISSWLPPR
jgi:hypothetical protein